jgi:hypothetical protein
LFTVKGTDCHHLVLLLLSGIEPNPGPRRPRFPCGICDKACKTNVIACDDCDKWIHKSCLGMTTDELDIGNSDEKWTCSKQNNSSSIVYHVPENPLESTINLSTHPSRLDSLSSMSLPSTSRSSVGSNYSLLSPLRNAGSPLMTSSPKHTTKTNNEFHQNRLTRTYAY